MLARNDSGLVVELTESGVEDGFAGDDFPLADLTLCVPDGFLVADEHDEGEVGLRGVQAGHLLAGLYYYALFSFIIPFMDQDH